MKKKILIVVLSIVSFLTASAQYISETLTLSSGWNAVYMESTPEEASCDAFFADLPVTRVAAYLGDAYRPTALFDENGQPIQQKSVSYYVWQKGESEANTLSRLAGGWCYLIYATAACEKTFLGIPAVPQTAWRHAAADGEGLLNLVGVTLAPDGYAQVRLGCDQAMGKVKGAKILKLDSKGTAKTRINATAARGYVFAGWYLDPDFSKPASFVTGSGKNAKPKDYRCAAQSLTVTGDISLFARFVEKTAESDPIEHLRFLGAGYCGADAGESAETETWYQGVALPTNCTVAFDSASLPKVTVKGLPAGVRCDDVRRCFTGTPKKAGEFTVKVTVKNRSGVTDVLTKRVTVVPLPGWAVGRFDGCRMESGAMSGTFSASVGSTGMVRGRTASGLASATFSAKSFSNVFTPDGENLIYVVDVTSKSKVGGEKSVKTDTLCLMEDVETGLGTIGGGDTDGCGAVGVQRAWDRKDLAYPAFDTEALKDPLPLGNGITLKFGAKGKVKIGGKINGVKANGSTYVLPFAWHSTMTGNLLAQVPVYIAPKRNLESGFFAVYDVLLTVGADGRFDTASVASFEAHPSNALDYYKLLASMRIYQFSYENGKAAGEAWASVVDETSGQTLLDELLRRTKIDVLATPSLDKGEWSVIGSPTTDGEGGWSADERPAAETPAQMFFKLRLR